MLTKCATSTPTVRQIFMDMSAVMDSAVPFDPAHADHEIVEAAIQRLGKITNDAIAEQFVLCRTRIREKMHSLQNRARLNKLQKTQLAGLQILWTDDDSIVPLYVKIEKAIKALDGFTSSNMENLAKIITDGKELYENQIRTMVKLMFYVLLNKEKAGTIIGALQSGKTGIGMAIKLMMAPMIYLLTGVRMFPHFISTNQSNHVLQSQDAHDSFLALYGNVEFHATRNSGVSINFGGYYKAFSDLMADEMKAFSNTNEKENNHFRRTPTMSAYKDVIARYDDADDREEMDNADRVLQRTNGKSVNDIHRMMDIAKKHNFYLLLILDEPQWGSSGDYAHLDDNGKLRGGVLNQMFYNKMADIIGAKSMHMLVGLSATPFGLSAAKKMFALTAYLPDNYFGPNCYDGKQIDPSKPTHSPLVWDWETLDFHTGINDANLIWPLLTFDRSKLPPSTKSDDSYRVECRRRGAKLLKQVFHKMVSNPDTAHLFGALMRLQNSNDATELLIDEAQLGKYFNIVRFYSNTEEARRLSANLKEELNKHRGVDGKPVLILVTGKARMGDSFPSWIEFFMDCSKTTRSDMNAKLQGVYGRGCGVGKNNSKVIVNDAIAFDLNKYVSTNGEYLGSKASPHVTRVTPALGQKVTERAQCAILGDGGAKGDRAIVDLLAQIGAAMNLSSDPLLDISEAAANNRFDITALLDQSGIVPHINENWSNFFPTLAGEIILPGSTRAQKVKKKGKVLASQTLVWPKADGHATVTVRHSSPAWYAQVDNSPAKWMMSFETNNRYYLADRASRLDTFGTETIDDKVLLMQGDSPEIDAFLDYLRQYETGGTDLTKAPWVDMKGRIAKLKAHIEGNHGTIWPNRYSENLKMLGGAIKKMTREGQTFILDEKDGCIKMSTYNRKDRENLAGIRVIHYSENTSNKTRPQILHVEGKINGVAWPADCAIAPRNLNGEVNLNIQINCAKFDALGNEIVDKNIPGVFRVVAICLPLTNRATPWVRGASDLPSPKSFGNEGMDKAQIAARDAEIAATGRAVPVKPNAPDMKPKRIRKAPKPKSRFDAVQAAN